jgi:hypothetical protein
MTRPRGTVEIKVTCLTIDRNLAAVGGQIRRNSGARVSRRLRSAVFFVQDNQATEQADRIGSLRVGRTLPAKCASSSSESLIALRSGDIAVDDAKP